MVQFLDPSDLFTTNAFGYGARVTGYRRWQPWTADPGTASGTGYAVPCSTIPQLHNGYGSNVAAFTGNTASTFCACLWRPQFFADGKASIQFTVTGITVADDFRYAGVAGRCAGGTFNNSFDAERYLAGNGYLFMLLNDAAHNILGRSLYVLLRLNSGTIGPTIIASAPGPLAADLPALLSVPFDMSMEAVGPHFTCNAGGATVISVDDNSGSSIQGAGRWGFGMIRDRVGSVGIIPLVRFFQLETPSGTVVHRDEWSRASPTTAQQITDGFGIHGLDMMCMWGADDHSSLGAVFEADIDRVKNQTAADVRAVSMRAATSATLSQRSLTVTYSGNPTHTELAGVYIRATGLVDVGGSTVFPFYALQLNKATSGIFTATLLAGGGPGSAVVATATIPGLLFNTDIVLAVRAVNNGSVPQIYGTINGVAPVWVAGPAVGFQINGNGTVEDHRGSPNLSGLEEGFLLSMSGSGSIITADTWLDTAPAPPGGQTHLSQELIEGFARIGIQPGDPMLVPEMRLSQLYLEGFAGGDLEIRLSQLLVEGFYGTDVAGIHLSQLLLEGFRDTAISSALDNCLVAQVAMPGAERVSAATASNLAAASRCGVERMSAKTAVVAAVGCGIGGVERMGVICG